MKIVRRARKSLKERRMKACLNELTSNLSKVELRVHNHLKKHRETVREARGQTRPPVPKDIIDGVMNEELYLIECRLHQEAGLPPPPPYAGRRAAKFVGMVPFVELQRSAVAATRAQSS
mmetsp:Transcript_43374/g.50184  ORF Transcript_43374/g.50184 Transcript_43374/m.50184 type:complete len:119 (+) Transcript_43374:57-413(+)